MLLLRNPEIKKMLVSYGLFTLAAVTAAPLLAMPPAIYALLICAGALALFLYYTKRRYKDISHLSGQLDQILHGDMSTCFVPDKEGELALLTSEIYKMTVRLQEQSELLQKEKDYLSSSIADISHQIKTPLTSIRMIVPRLGREGADAGQRQQYIRDISSLLSRTEWLISSLLKIARLETGTVAFGQTPVNVEELVSEALAPLAVMLDVIEIPVATDIDENAAFSGDRLWSVEAVGNILKNCMEHTSPGGTLTVNARDNPLFTGITISDDGTGIAPEDLPHLFERFYRGKDSGPEHAGIGLALAQMIIKQQNGTVAAKNRTPRGTEFHIRFYKGAI